MSVLILDHTDFSIKRSPVGITVTDGQGTIKAPFTEGNVTYSRSTKGGILYINGVEVGRHHSPCKGVSNECQYYGTGTIRSVRMHTFSQH